MRELILVRGIPGAGKSTFAKMLSERMRNAFHYEGDAWRGYGNNRMYKAKFNATARWVCFGLAANQLRYGVNDVTVLVSNTFHTLDSMRPYALLVEELRARGMDVKITILTVEGPKGRSVHDHQGATEELRKNVVDYDYYIDGWEDYNGEFDEV